MVSFLAAKKKTKKIITTGLDFFSEKKNSDNSKSFLFTTLLDLQMRNQAHKYVCLKACNVM